MKAFLIRRKKGKTYQYFDGTARVSDESEIDRINKLAIPPAWKDVKIAKTSRLKYKYRATMQQVDYSQSIILYFDNAKKS